MKTASLNRCVKISIFGVCCVMALAVPSARAAFTTWELNPNLLNGAVGSASNSYTVNGSTITAYGFDNAGGPPNTPRELYYKAEPANTAGETGLGLVGTDSHELNVSNGIPLQYIQLSLGSILAQGFANGQVKVTSLQQGESFVLFGSNTLGTLGTQIGGPFGFELDNQWVSLPNFGTYQYVAFAAASGRVLPVAFQAELVPIPEAASFIPVALLAVGAMLLEVRRRRRASA